MANVTVLIRTMDDQLVPAAIDNVLVRVFDALDVFVTEGLTGSVTPGEIEFTLPGFVGGTDYILRFFKAGVSFLPEPRLDITITDVDPPATVITGHVGEIGAVATLVSQTDETTPVPIPDTLFKVYSALGAFLTQGPANAQGKLELPLDAAQYIIRMSKSGWVFTNGPTQTIEVLSPLPVGGTNIFDFPASQPVAPQSTDPYMCLMSGYFVDVAMHPLKRLRLRFMPVLNDPDVKMSGFPGAGDPSVILRNQIFNEVVFETDDNGYIEVLLPRKSCYDVHIHGYETPGVPQYAQIYVPDASWAHIEDVFFPYTVSVSFDPPAVVVPVETMQTSMPNIIGSNTQTLDNKYAKMFLDFTVADPTVATAEVGSDGAIQVHGVAVGSTILNVARSSTKSTFVPRRPDIPDLIVTPLAITVT